MYLKIKYFIIPIIISFLIFPASATVVLGQGAEEPAKGAGLFGSVDSPYGAGYTGEMGGLIIFLTNILRLIFLIAGLFSLIKIVIAGLNWMSAGGEPKKIEQAWANIWQSIIGLLIIVSSFALAAIIGQLLFGKADYILNPTLFGVGK